ISYTHAYLQETNKGECRGWESLVLPFDVQTITHQKGEIKPFLAYHLNAEDALPDSYLPFWLYEFTEEGQFRAAEAVRANTPYILSMPNDDHNDPHYDLSGSVTFKAENAEVKASQDAVTVTGNGRTFRPAYQERLTGEGCYVLNVGKTHAGLAEGSVFVRNLRDVRPFEAYFTVDGGAVKEDFFSVFDGLADRIEDIKDGGRSREHVGCEDDVYDLSGRKVHNAWPKMQNDARFQPGIYIVNGRKVVVK
ncbi:MAG: hypothetical protein J6W75_09725, partial [Bacteroidaceae bacterium]|nr:hypothetical protein [Bacteroidaceae bacterium]